MARNRFAACAAAAMIAVASIGLTAAPAEADTTSSGCTVLTPKGPRADGRDGSNRVIIKYVVEVTCKKGRTIRIQQQRWEEDKGDDQYLGYYRWTQTFDKDASMRFTYRIRMEKTEKENEEMYQRVRFRVTEGLTISEWTKWERGPASWIFH